MTQRTWLITGVSSGFGRTDQQLLARGDRVVGTVRKTDAVADLVTSYPDLFRAEILDVTDTAAIRDLVDRTFADLGHVDVVVSNAGYGLFGAGEEYTDDQIRHVIDTNLVGSIQLIRCGPAAPARPGRGQDHPAVELRRAGRVPGLVVVPRD